MLRHQELLWCFGSCWVVDEASREKIRLDFVWFSDGRKKKTRKKKSPLHSFSCAVKQCSRENGQIKEIKGVCNHWKIKIVFLFLFNNKIIRIFTAFAELFCGINKEAELPIEILTTSLVTLFPVNPIQSVFHYTGEKTLRESFCLFKRICINVMFKTRCVCMFCAHHPCICYQHTIIIYTPLHRTHSVCTYTVILFHVWFFFFYTCACVRFFLCEKTMK